MRHLKNFAFGFFLSMVLMVWLSMLIFMLDRADFVSAFFVFAVGFGALAAWTRA